MTVAVVRDDTSNLTEVDVFIAYKREERDIADAVSADLQASGYTVVTDDDVQEGDIISFAIDRMIRNAKVVVVLWTAKSVVSSWVHLEASLAVKMGKYIGVILENDIAENIERLGLFGEISAVNLSEVEFQGRYSSIVTAVGARIGKSETPEEEASERSVSAQEELTYFQSTKTLDILAGYQEYLKEYPNGAFKADAEKRIAELNSYSVRIKEKFFSLHAVALYIAFAGVLVPFVMGLFSGPQLNDFVFGSPDQQAITVELKRSKAELKEIQAEYSALDSINSGLQLDLNRKNAEAAELSSEKAELQSRVSNLQDARARLLNSIAQLETRTAELQAHQGKTKQLEDKLDASSGRATELERQVTSLEAENSDLGSTIDGLLKVIRTKESEVGVLSQQLNDGEVLSLELEQLGIPELVLRAQSVLYRTGCYSGAIDGIWGEGSQSAVSEFMENAFLLRSSYDGDRKAYLTDLLKRIEGFDLRVCPLSCTDLETEVDGQCVLKTCPAGSFLTTRGICVPRTRRPAPSPPSMQDSLFGNTLPQ